MDQTPNTPAAAETPQVAPALSTFSARLSAAQAQAAQNPSLDTNPLALAEQLQQQDAEARAATTPAETPAETTQPELETPATEKKGFDAFSDEPATEEKQPEAEEEPPAGVRTKEAREAWKAGRLAQKQIPELQKQIEEWKAKAEARAQLEDADPLKKEIEALRQRDAEREQEAAIWRIERTQAYKDAISQPLAKLEEQALQIAKDNELDANKLFDALSEPDRKTRREKMSSLTESMPEDDKFFVYDIAAKTHEIYARRDEMEKNAHVAYQEAQAREKEMAERTTTERRAAEMRAVTELKPKVLAAAASLIREGESAEAFAERIVTEANTVPFDEQPANVRAFQAVAAKLFDEMAPKYRAALDKIAKLERQISGITATTPRAANGTPALPAQTAVTRPFGERLREAAQSWMGG